MKQILFAIAFLFLLSGNIGAQAPHQKALLWKISGNGLKQNSYLYGTFHLLCPEDMKLNEKVLKSVEKTKALYLELDFSSPQTSMDMQQAMLMKDGHQISEYVDSAAFSAMADTLRAWIGMPLQFLQSVKPMMLVSMLYPKVLGCTPKSPEIALMQHADAKGLTIHGLEKVADQMKIFDTIPYNVQADMLKEYLASPGKMAEETERSLGFYRNQDLQEMYDMIVAEGEDFAPYADIMLFDRNARWVNIIRQESMQKPVFYAVGAGHLGGDKGVIALLRQTGFKVEPVK